MLQSDYKQVNDLIADRAFDRVYSMLREAIETDESADVWYLLIKARVIEIQWALALEAGPVRSQKATKFIREDYAGLICSLSQSYINSFDENGDPRYGIVKRIHDLAATSLPAQAHSHNPMQGFNVQVFVERMTWGAAFFTSIETLVFSD